MHNFFPQATVGRNCYRSMGRKRTKQSLCVICILAFLCLVVNLQNFRFLLLFELPTAVLTGFSPLDESGDHRRNSLFEISGRLTNFSEHLSENIWRVQRIQPFYDSTDYSCDPIGPSLWPEWMKTKMMESATLSSNDYRSILDEYPPLNRDPSDLPIPLKILQEYKRQHSLESLKQSPGCRKYLVASYRCPISAGNRLHEFANSFFWAVVLNRTLLYKYLDEPYCRLLSEKYVHAYDSGQCTQNSSIVDCDSILDRAPWIPSYDEWRTRLDLAPPYYMKVQDFGPQSHFQLSPVGIDVAYHRPQVLVIRPVSRRFDEFSREPRSRPLKLKLNSTLERVDALFSLGHRFLFGLLFRSAFDFRKQIRPTQHSPTGLQRVNLGMQPISIALHSRHVHEEDSGCNVTQEIKCLHNVWRQLPPRRRAQVPCTIALLSDRRCTLSSLQTHLAENENGMRCAIVVADHEEGTGAYAEHGPFAGAGFFQDLAVASSIARTAVIGSSQPPHYNTWRTSSEILEELIEYHRFMAAWQEGRDVSSVPELIRCGIVR